LFIVTSDPKVICQVVRLLKTGQFDQAGLLPRRIYCGHRYEQHLKPLFKALRQ